MIDLTSLSAQVATPELVEFGGWLTPSLGGPSQRLDRFGDRYALDVVLPPMRIEPDGRRWKQRLMQAVKEGASFAFPQVDFDVGAPGTPTVNGAVAGGTSLPLKGLTLRYPLKEGQFISITHAGVSYLHSVNAQAIADGSGNATVSIFPMLRTALVDGDVVEVARPVITGKVVGGPWPLEMTRTIGLTFRIEETQ